MSLLRNSALKFFEKEMTMKSSGLSDVRLFSLLSCHYRPEVFEAVFQAQGLHSIWLTWKQMCFHRADWAFIAACGKLGFTASVWLKKKDSQVPEKLLMSLFLFLFTECIHYTDKVSGIKPVTSMRKWKLTRAIKSNKRPTATFLLVNFSGIRLQIWILLYIYTTSKSG